LILILAIIILTPIALKNEKVQNFAVKKASEWLSNKTKGDFDIGHVEVSFFDKINLQDVAIKDKNGTNILEAKNATVNVSLFNYFDQQLHIDEIILDSAKIKITKYEGADDWNFKELIDALSSENKENTSIENNDTSQQNWDLRFNKFNISNSNFILDDIKGGKLLTVDFKNADGFIDQIIPEENVFDFSNVSLIQPDLYFERKSIPNDDDEDDSNPSAVFDTDAYVKIDKINIEDGKAQIVDVDQNINIEPALVNLANLKFFAIQSQIENVNLRDDSLFLNIKKMRLKEQSGLDINHAVTKLSIIPGKIELDKMYMRTDYSEFKDYLSLRFKSMDDFGDFINEVKIKTNVKESYFALLDIDYLTKLQELVRLQDSQMNELIKIDGEFRGTVNSIRGKNVKLELANYSIIEGSFSSRDITNPEVTFLDVRLDKLITDMDEIARLVPQLKIPTEVKKLGNIRFNGNYTGFYNDFVFYGELFSDVGYADADINVKLFDEPYYKGDLKIKEFELGNILNRTDQFGKISFDLKLDGTGISPETVNADLDGQIYQFEVDGRNYQDIKLDGILDQRTFKGKFDIKDEIINLAFDGYIDLNDSIPKFAIDTNIDNIDLQQLNVVNEDFQMSANASLDMQGNDIDNFTGTIELTDVNIVMDGQTYPFDTIYLKAEEIDDERVVDIESEILDGNFKGQFSLRDIHYAVQNIITSYISYQLLPDSKQTNDTYGYFDVDVKDLTQVKRFVDFPVDSLEGSHIEGYFNTITNNLNLVINSPKLVYGENSADSVYVRAFTNAGKLKVQSTIENIYTLDSIRIENTKLDGLINNDTLQFVLNTAQADAPNRVMLDGNLSVLKDTLSLVINESDININNKEWFINSGRVKYLSRDYFLIENVELASEGQTIFINNSPDDDGKSVATFEGENLKLEEILAIAGPGRYNAAGTLNGNIVVNDLLGIPAIEGAFKIDSLSYNDAYLGNFNFLGLKRPGTQILDTEIQLIDDENNLSAVGIIDYTSNEPTLDFAVATESYSITFLEAIIGAHVENTRGTIIGNAVVNGKLTEPEIEAELKLNNAGTKIKFLQTDYRADNQTLYVKGRKLIFPNMELLDEQDNTASVSGIFDLTNIDRPSLEILANTDYFQFLNTTKKDSDYFYGEAFGSGNIYVEGFLDDVEVYVNATSEKGTNIRLPLDADSEEEEATFYTFINNNVEADSLANDTAKYELDLNLFTFFGDFDVTNDALVQIIFDEKAGDIIKSVGEGNLKMEVNTLGDFSMFGQYEITQGDYLFTMQNVINKKFVVKPGGQITWTGDPFSALLDVDAIYERKASPYDLVSDQAMTSDDEAKAKQRVPSRLNLQLRGDLLTPDIKMAVDVDRIGSGITDVIIQNRVNEINNSDAELNKQVFGLLVLNRFLPYNSASNATASDGLSSGINTLSEYLSNQISNYLSDALSEFVDDVDFSYENYNAESDLGSEVNRNEFALGFGKKLLNDRLYINVGGNLQLGEEEAEQVGLQNSSVIAGDFLIEYSLTADGKLKIKAYNQSDYDIITKRYNKTGVGLSYQETFSDYGDLFRFKKK